MDAPDTIAVNVEVKRKVYASSADMYVEIRGHSFISGRAALKQAREVRDLVTALGEVGIAESGIEIVGIRAEVASGVITKSSSAVYRLRIELPSLDQLADALGAVTSRKNANITLLEWQYTAMEELHDELLGEAVRRAGQRAALICRELNHRNLGAHSLTEKFKDAEDKQSYSMLASAASVDMRRRGPLTAEDLGLDVTHAKTVSIDVRVEYRVQPETESDRAAAADG